MGDWGFVAAGYILTAVALGGYVAHLLRRAGLARRRGAALVDPVRR